jgi:hypothetical protein
MTATVSIRGSPGRPCQGHAPTVGAAGSSGAPESHQRLFDGLPAHPIAVEDRFNRRIIGALHPSGAEPDEPLSRWASSSSGG